MEIKVLCRHLIAVQFRKHSMKIKWLYVLLVGTVICLTVINQTIIQWYIDKNKSNSTVINHAGRQRMLSQSMIKQLYQAKNGMRNTDSLKVVVSFWNEVHFGLQNGSANRGLPVLNNREIELEFDKLNPIQEDFYSAMIEAIEVHQGSGLVDFEYLNKVGDRYYSKMDQIVSLFEDEARQQLSIIGIIEISLAAFSVLIIVLEVYFIFKPSFRKLVESEALRVESDQLRKKNITISDLNKTLSEKSEELHSSKSMLKSLIDNVPLMLVVLDTKGKILSGNFRFYEFFDIDKGDTRQLYFDEILPDRIFLKHKELFGKALGGEYAGFEEKVLNNKKKWFYGYGAYAPVFENGVVSKLTVFVADITELKSAQEELHRVNDVRTKLFHVISHDLKGPVASLKGVFEMLLDNNISQEEFRDLSTDLYRNVNYLYHTIETLFHWTYLQLDSSVSSPEKVKLKDFTSVVISQILPVAKAKGQNIENLAQSDVLVWADSYQLKVVLRNLVTNAIKFSPEKSTITIESDYHNGHVNLIVCDSGKGMDKEMVQKVLSENMSGYVTTPGTRNEKGIGLGLPLCVQLLKSNKGKLSIESVPGKGTKAIVGLPKFEEII